jgi:FAD/FMN-containing dehydrogenase
MPLEVSAETIAVMQRVKHAFDPKGLLNPGKIFLS